MWKANELFECLQREASVEDIRELLKALIAYDINQSEYTEAVDKTMDKVIDVYYDRDDIESFINQDIYFMAEEMCGGAEDE